MNNSISTLTHWIPGKSHNFAFYKRQVITKHLRKSKWIKRKKIHKIKNYDERKISIAGLAEVLNSSNSWRKRFFWLIVFLVFSIFCCFQLVQCVKLYFEFPTFLQTEIVDGSKVSFPAIYICPGVLRNMQRSFNEISECLETNKICTTKDLYAAAMAKNFPRFDSIPPITIQELWSLIAIKSSDLSHFIPCGVYGIEGSCGLLGKEVPNPGTNIATFWGSCFVSNASSEIDYRGPLTYIKVLHKNRFHQNVIERLNEQKKKTNETQLIKSIEETLQQPKVAFMVSVFHENKKNRQHKSFYQSFEAFQGYEMHVQLQRKQFQYMNKKSKPCFSEDEWLECFNNCVEKLMSKECSVPYYTQTHLSRNCTWDNNYIALHLYNSEAYNKFSVADCSCPGICENTIYVNTLNVIEKLYNQSHTLVKFYFADQTFEHTVEKYYYTFRACLSDIGGNLGFFLGFSILTILELTECLFSYATKRWLQL